MKAARPATKRGTPIWGRWRGARAVRHNIQSHHFALTDGPRNRPAATSNEISREGGIMCNHKIAVLLTRLRSGGRRIFPGPGSGATRFCDARGSGGRIQTHWKSRRGDRFGHHRTRGCGRHSGSRRVKPRRRRSVISSMRATWSQPAPTAGSASTLRMARVQSVEATLAWLWTSSCTTQTGSPIRACSV